MGLFGVDSLVMCYSNLEVAKLWWIEVFDCTQVGLPDWDNPLPSDVALKLTGDDEPTILLCDQREVQAAGFERAKRSSPHVFGKANESTRTLSIQGRGAWANTSGRQTVLRDPRSRRQCGRDL
jgi:hypothetical protein